MPYVLTGQPLTWIVGGIVKLIHYGSIGPAALRSHELSCHSEDHPTDVWAMVERLKLLLKGRACDLKIVLAPAWQTSPVYSLPDISNVRAMGTHPPGLVLLRAEESWYASLRQFGRVSA